MLAGMTASLRMVLVGSPLLMAGCGGSEKAAAHEPSSASAALSSPVWQGSAPAHPYLCADVCGARSL
jgi:hypothetical protein